MEINRGKFTLQARKEGIPQLFIFGPHFCLVERIIAVRINQFKAAERC